MPTVRAPTATIQIGGDIKDSTLSGVSTEIAKDPER